VKLLVTGGCCSMAGQKGEGVFDRAAATVLGLVDRRKTEVKGNPG